MKTLLTIAALLLIITSCTDELITLNEANAKTSMMSTDNMNGRGGVRMVYYDDQLVSVNMKELSDNAAEQIINGGHFAEIYAYNDLDEPQDFLSIIEGIPGEEGFSPLWLQFLIVFNDGFTPHQFTSEEDVEAAATEPNPEITLVNTEEIYRCSVVGAK